MAKPTVEVLDKADVNVTIGMLLHVLFQVPMANRGTPLPHPACRTLDNAQKLAHGFKHTKAISLDVNDDAALDRELEKNDLVISLIPYTYHPQVIRAAIRTRKHVVTTSYVSPAMKELEEEAKKAGITVMNEIGLDPVGLAIHSAMLVHL